MIWDTLYVTARKPGILGSQLGICAYLYILILFLLYTNAEFIC